MNDLLTWSNGSNRNANLHSPLTTTLARHLKPHVRRLAEPRGGQFQPDCRNSLLILLADGSTSCFRTAGPHPVGNGLFTPLTDAGKYLTPFSLMLRGCRPN